MVAARLKMSKRNCSLLGGSRGQPDHGAPCLRSLQLVPAERVSVHRPAMAGLSKRMPLQEVRPSRLRELRPGGHQRAAVETSFNLRCEASFEVLQRPSSSGTRHAHMFHRTPVALRNTFPTWKDCYTVRRRRQAVIGSSLPVSTVFPPGWLGARPEPSLRALALRGGPRRQPEPHSTLLGLPSGSHGLWSKRACGAGVPLEARKKPRRLSYEALFGELNVGLSR
jgi:hypothetical protein